MSGAAVGGLYVAATRRSPVLAGSSSATTPIVITRAVTSPRPRAAFRPLPGPSCGRKAVYPRLLTHYSGDAISMVIEAGYLMKREHDIPAAAMDLAKRFLEPHPDINAKFKSASSAELKRVARKRATVIGSAWVAGLRIWLSVLTVKYEESEFGKFGWVMDPEGNRIELWPAPEGQ